MSNSTPPAVASDSCHEFIYEQLRRVAAARMHKSGRTPSLKPTEVVNEAYMRLARRMPRSWVEAKALSSAVGCSRHPGSPAVRRAEAHDMPTMTFKEQVERLFDAAQDAAPADRIRFVHDATPHDPALRAEVLGLLGH